MTSFFVQTIGLLFGKRAFKSKKRASSDVLRSCDDRTLSFNLRVTTKNKRTKNEFLYISFIILPNGYSDYL